MKKKPNKILTRYARKLVDPNFYGKIVISELNSDISELKPGEPGDEPGFILAPYVLAEHSKESLERYREFMAKYKEEHKYCPNCGGTDFCSTLMGYVLNSEKPEDYKDLNRCTCSTCGNVHTRHDRTNEATNI